MWITKLALICCLATALSTSSEIKTKKKTSTELRGKRNLEYSIAHPNPVYGYRTERRISSGHRTNYFPAHKHYITFRRGRPAPSPPPYAVQMEPLVHYSQRDPLYDAGNLPISPGNDLASDYQHIHPQTYGHPPPPPPKIIEKPIYIKEPEPIIEIIIKESNVTLPPPPAPVIVTPAPKRKEPVHVFYVKYKKNPNGYGKDSIIYEKPIPAISPPVEDEEPQQEEPPQEPIYAPPVTPPPQTPSTTLRAIIKPESDYSGNKHIHVRFEKPSNNQYKRTSTSDDDSKEESAPEPVISQPQSRKFIFPPPPPQGRSPSSFPPKIISRPPPQFRPESQRFAPPPPPPSFRPFNQPPSFKPPPFPASQFPPLPNRPNFHPPSLSLDRPPAPSSQQQLPSHQHVPFRQPVAYKPFDNYVPSDTINLQPSTSFTPPQQQRPSNFEQNPNLPPQSFSNFLTHFPEQQHLPQVQKHHIFHTPQQQVPQKQYSQLPEQQQIPQLQKQLQFNPQQQHQSPEQPKPFLDSSHQPQAQAFVGSFGENANKEQFTQHQQFTQQQSIPQQGFQQQFRNDHNQNLPFHNQLPRLPQHQLLPSSQRLNNFNSIPTQPQHQQQQHPQQHQEENVLPPGGELIPSVSKYEQHITLPSETKEQQTNYQLNSQQHQPQQQQHQLQQQHQHQLQQQQQHQLQQQHQHQLQQQQQQQPHQSQQNQQRQQQQQQHHQQQIQQQYFTQVNPSDRTLGQQQQYQQYPQQLNTKNTQQQNQYNIEIKPSEERGNSISIANSNYLQKNQQQQQQQSVTTAPHRFSSVYSTTTGRTTYQSTTTAPTTTTKNPEKEEKAKKNILELPDEVPDDLRQQLLSSGILENAQISVLDYDKVGDIPLSALPPEQLSQFFGAGGKEAISAGSEPVPSIIRKNGEPLDDLATPDQEPEGSDPAEVKVIAPEVKVVQYEKDSVDEKKIGETYIKEGASQVEAVQLDSEKYTRYLPIKVNGAQFPIPDVPELKGKNITSVVVLAPVEYTGNKGRPVREIISTERLLAGQALKELIKNPTTENFQKWLEIENTTAVDKQSVVLLVTKPEEAKEEDEKEIFMYDLNTKTVSKLSGELSSAFVEAAEANTSDNLEAIAPSNIVETRVPYPDIDRRDLVAFTDEDFQYDLSDASSQLVESRIPIIDPMEEKDEDEYEVEASEQLEQFVDISGLKVRPEDLAAAASDNLENQVIVSSGYSKTGSNKLPSPT
ncbi:mediator of RNA polymerase II transcription subunit 15-like [Agrilus planipennis]|uniref:Mediator of RNA polymerase II transcription subunit 15-like n=1 Tax=Agrilus planipennis TaxID=224129 RepID=A0A7F5R853_AGRPL|nr:mediator of RNA polymerase II transcription subunit 15-like [Agrilus planipennis]